MKFAIVLPVFLIAVICIMGGQADVARTRYDNDRDNYSPSQNRGGNSDAYGRPSNSGDKDTGRFLGRPGNDQYGPATKVCVCPRTSTRIFMPVCGTDGETYNNVCLLNCKRDESHSNRNLRVACNRACPCGGYSG